MGAQKQALCGEGQRRSGTVNGVAGSPPETERKRRLQPEGWRLDPFQTAYAEHRGDACTLKKSKKWKKPAVQCLGAMMPALVNIDAGNG
jgi:hypothetical protein